jgi:hypothetical protein
VIRLTSILQGESHVKFQLAIQAKPHLVHEFQLVVEPELIVVQLVVEPELIVVQLIVEPELIVV